MKIHSIRDEHTVNKSQHSPHRLSIIRYRLVLNPIGHPHLGSNRSFDEKSSALFSPTMMQTASYHTTNQVSQLTTPSSQPSTESIRTSVAQLLSQAHNLPCSKAAQAFSQLLPHISRFQLALDALLPSLDEGNEVCGCSHPSSSRSLP